MIPTGRPQTHFTAERSRCNLDVGPRSPTRESIQEAQGGYRVRRRRSPSKGNGPRKGSDETRAPHVRVLPVDACYDGGSTLRLTDSTIAPPTKPAIFLNKRFVAARYEGGCYDKDIFTYCLVCEGLSTDDIGVARTTVVQ